MTDILKMMFAVSLVFAGYFAPDVKRNYFADIPANAENLTAPKVVQLASMPPVEELGEAKKGFNSQFNHMVKGLK
jgi:hypothetical protein